MIYFILNPPRDESGRTQERMWINYVESWLNNQHLSLVMNFDHCWHTNHCNSLALPLQDELASGLQFSALHNSNSSVLCVIMKSWAVVNPWLNVLNQVVIGGDWVKIKAQNMNE